MVISWFKQVSSWFGQDQRG